MGFIDVVAKQSMGAPNLVNVLNEEINYLQLNNSYDILNSLFFSPSSILVNLLMFMKIVNLQNNIIFSHIPPTEERIMKRNFDGTIGKWDNIRDWIFDINMQYKESVYTFIMYGAKYCNSLIGLDQDDIEKLIDENSFYDLGRDEAPLSSLVINLGTNDLTRFSCACHKAG